MGGMGRGGRFWRTVEWGGCSTCQRGLRISFSGGLGLCVGRHDGVKHGWRQPRGNPISTGGGGDKQGGGAHTHMEVLKEIQSNNKPCGARGGRSSSKQLLSSLKT